METYKFDSLDFANNSDIFWTTKSRSWIWANKNDDRAVVTRIDLSIPVLVDWFSAGSISLTSLKGITKLTNPLTYNEMDIELRN